MDITMDFQYQLMNRKIRKENLRGRRVADFAQNMVRELDLDESYYTILVMKGYGKENVSYQGSVNYHKEFLLIAKEIVKGFRGCHLFAYGNDRTGILLISRTEKELEKESMYISRILKNTAESYLRDTVTVGIGTFSHRAGEANDVLASARLALEDDYVYGCGRIYKAGQYYSQAWAESVKGQDAVLTLLQKNDTRKMEEQIKDFIRYLQYHHIPPEQCRQQMQNMIFGILQYLRELGMEHHMICEEGKKLTDDIARDDTLMTTGNRVTKYCLHAAQVLHQDKGGVEIRLMALAKEFLEKHFMEMDLQLDSVCVYLEITPAQFTVLYKKYYRETFRSGLTRLRMEKAKVLLAQDIWKVREVACKVGYRDPHAFGEAFRKYTGVTPKMYSKENYVNRKRS